MSTTEIDAMTRALNGYVTLFFDTEEEARAFRRECYRKRDALRLVGIHKFDWLKFRLVSNTLTIRDKQTKINAMA